MLNAHEVLARGDLGGKREGEFVLLPDEVARVSAVPRGNGAELEDFEPGARAVVLGDVAGGFGHVDLYPATIVRKPLQHATQSHAHGLATSRGSISLTVSGPGCSIRASKFVPNPITSLPATTFAAWVFVRWFSDPLLHRMSLLDRKRPSSQDGWNPLSCSRV